MQAKHGLFWGIRDSTEEYAGIAASAHSSIYMTDHVHRTLMGASSYRALFSKRICPCQQAGEHQHDNEISFYCAFLVQSLPSRSVFSVSCACDNFVQCPIEILRNRFGLVLCKELLCFNSASAFRADGAGITPLGQRREIRATSLRASCYGEAVARDPTQVLEKVTVVEAVQRNMKTVPVAAPLMTTVSTTSPPVRAPYDACKVT